MRVSTQKLLEKLVIYTILLIATIIVTFPTALAFYMSIRHGRAFIYGARSEFKFSFDNYLSIFRVYPFHQYTLNSITVATATSVVCFIIAILPAYSFARFRTGGARMPLFILALRMLPPIAIIIPLFLIFDSLRLVGSPLSLVLAHTIILLPFVIWMLTEFIRGVPIELEESAMVDGCGRIDAFLRILLPCIKPGVAATVVFTFLMSFNEFLFALILLGTGGGRTLPVAVSGFWTSEYVAYGPMFAAVVLVLIPCMIMTFTIQKYLVAGLTVGAIKR